jgi:hypothetical protein
VTSIPVIWKILFALGIMHSRFAKIVVGVAGIHDIILWVALAVSSGIDTRRCECLGRVVKPGHHFVVPYGLFGPGAVDLEKGQLETCKLPVSCFFFGVFTAHPVYTV